MLVEPSIDSCEQISIPSDDAAWDTTLLKRLCHKVHRERCRPALHESQANFLERFGEDSTAIRRSMLAVA